MSLSIHNRNGIVMEQSPTEKLVILPELDCNDPCIHAWTDARFAIDIMAEHALFFVLLMPPAQSDATAAAQQEAFKFNSKFTSLFETIDLNGPPSIENLSAFCHDIEAAMHPFIEYKRKCLSASMDGSLRSLVWPLFFKHTLDEAERWSRRMRCLANGDSSLNFTEVTQFWSGIMDEHARFEEHLLDPDEFKLISKCIERSQDWRVIKDMIDPDPDMVSGQARRTLEFETASVRGVEAAKIKSIIDPRLADHLRRETVKFVDELQRVSSNSIDDGTPF